MTREEYLLQAKTIIFGEPPECPLALIGHNMAITYFTPLIWEAEMAYHNRMKPPHYLVTQIEKAFLFPSYKALQTLPYESMAALKKCTENFKGRYEPFTAAFNQPHPLQPRKILRLRSPFSKGCAKIKRKIKGV